MFLRALDWLLTAVHLLVISAFLLLWIWPSTRKLHLMLVCAVAVSWFGIGFWKGWGYCFITDWHWRIKHALGVRDASGSFIHYLVQAAGIPASPQLTDRVVAVVFSIVVLLSLALNGMSGFRGSADH
jgi:hypothetical protein